MLYEIVNDFPHEIIFDCEGPFISLYQPTFRHRPENRQDLIRFKNLIQRIQNSLTQKYPKSEIEKRMKPFNGLAEDKAFWNNTKDGLAILSCKNKTIVYKLSRPVKEFAVVADSFHIKPLIRAYQSADRYHLLGLSRKNFILYEGNRYGFEEVQLDSDIPRTVEDVLGDEYSEPYLNPGAYGGTGGAPMYHGHGGRKDEINKDTERYFRYVDKLVLDNFSKLTNIPLILVGLDEHHGLFRNITNNPHLISDGIKKDYETISKDELRKEAWRIIEPFYLEKTKQLVERYELQKSKFLGSDDLAQVARAVLENRVDALMIESDRIEAGKINKETGLLERGDIENPDNDDMLDDLAQMVYEYKGEVVILPEERMPSTTGVAAIYRY